MSWALLIYFLGIGWSVVRFSKFFPVKLFTGQAQMILARILEFFIAYGAWRLSFLVIYVK